MEIDMTTNRHMNDFTINEMLRMQETLQEKYRDKWDPICPERGKDQLLWMIGEVGEVIDIVKKHGGEAACQDEALRGRMSAAGRAAAAEYDWRKLAKRVVDFYAEI